MNDYDFSERISPTVAAVYREAKRSAAILPRHTLIQTRALASLCCDELGAHALHAAEGLEAKIAALWDKHRINPGVKDLLHRLRRLGNQAAHPEEAGLADKDIPALARQALEAARELLAIVFQQRHGGAAIPEFEIASEAAEQLDAVCFKAMVENSPADQYQVAMHLQACLRRRMEEVDRALAAGEITYYCDGPEERSLRRRALDLLEYADGQRFAPACYAYGVALAEGARGEAMVAMGVNCIAVACSMGDIDALAWCGRAALEGRFDYEVDFELARGYLERAAAEDHPEALTLLSRMYAAGQGMPADPRKAFALTLRAAEAGYPAARYQAAVALLSGDGVEQDRDAGMAWLRKASEAGQPNALQLHARLLRAQGGSAAVDEAERLLARAATHLNAALLDLAELHVERGGGPGLLAALGALQACYERAVAEQDERLAEACRSRAPACVRLAERAYAGMGEDTKNDFIATRFLFDEAGLPYANRRERLGLWGRQAMALMRLGASDPEQAGRLLHVLGSGLPRRHRAQRLSRPAPPVPVTQRVLRHKVKRNEPCPCGSGSKFKACCGA